MALMVQKGSILNEKQPILQTGKAFKKPLDIIDFELRNQRNQLFTKNDFKDQFTLVFFGYTNCPDVCPTTIYKLSQIKKKINSEGGPVLSFTEADFATKISKHMQTFSLQQVLRSIIFAHSDF